MPLFSIHNVKVSGIAASVPAAQSDNMDCEMMNERERKLFVETVGIRYRRIASNETTASDLCFAAGDKLIKDLNWKREEIGILIFITQTPDYIIPNSSSILQDKLGLSKNTLVFDVNLGCSGYVYGLSIVGSLLQNMPSGKALLLVGDVSTHIISDKDKSTVPLFSDAGSATALEFKLNERLDFNLQTDGKGYEDIFVRDGGFRNKVSSASFLPQQYEPGVVRSNLDMKLDGLRIFNFALREVAPNIKALLSSQSLSSNDPDFFVFHQANKLMLDSVRKKLSVSEDKVPLSLFHFGNTSSASIPLTIVAQLRKSISSDNLKLLLSGFGVGLSWGSCYLHTSEIVCPELIEI